MEHNRKLVSIHEKITFSRIYVIHLYYSCAQPHERRTLTHNPYLLGARIGFGSAIEEAKHMHTCPNMCATMTMDF